LKPELGIRIRDGPRRPPNGDIEMIDVVMLAIGLGFFALSIGYVLACDRL
jgi:hypothetical protein